MEIDLWGELCVDAFCDRVLCNYEPRVRELNFRVSCLWTRATAFSIVTEQVRIRNANCNRFSVPGMEGGDWVIGEAIWITRQGSDIEVICYH